jgi:rSAM/selenodomain-associated transferase 1
VAIFARGVSPGRVKTRLMPLLGPRGAAEFHAALISDTVRMLNALGKRVWRYFFLAGRVCPASLSGYDLKRQRGGDLGERLGRAFRVLLRRHTAAVVIGTDSPGLPPKVLVQALRELRFCDAVLGPCPDGGYYLIGIRRQERQRLSGVFSDVRWGSSFAFRDTLDSFLRRGFICSILQPCADVDRPEDFRQLEMSMARSRAARRAAPAVWRFMNCFRQDELSTTFCGRTRLRHRK